MSIFPTRIAGLGHCAAGSAASKPSGLEAEIVALFGALHHPLARYLLSLRVPVADAEEIIQEIFLLLFQHLRDGKPCPQPQGWLFRAAHNYVLKFRANAQRHAERFDATGVADHVADNQTPGPEQRMQQLEHRDRLLAVVRVLPEQDRCCLSLRAEGLRYRDIASILGISLGAVANSLERSLTRLARAGGNRGML